MANGMATISTGNTAMRLTSNIRNCLHTSRTSHSHIRSTALILDINSRIRTGFANISHGGHTVDLSIHTGSRTSRGSTVTAIGGRRSTGFSGGTVTRTFGTTGNRWFSSSSKFLFQDLLDLLSELRISSYGRTLETTATTLGRYDGDDHLVYLWKAKKVVAGSRLVRELTARRSRVPTGAIRSTMGRVLRRVTSALTRNRHVRVHNFNDFSLRCHTPHAKHGPGANSGMRLRKGCIPRFGPNGRLHSHTGVCNWIFARA